MIVLFFNLLILFLLSGCTPPVFQNTTFGIDEFTTDSQQIAQGKLAILAWEEEESACCPAKQPCGEEIIIEGDELSVILHCPQREDRMHAFEIMDSRVGFRVCDGKICLPHLSPLTIAGLSLAEGREVIQSAYREQIQDVQIYIHFKKKRARQVQIIGTEETIIQIDGRMRLSEVLAKAKMPPYANLFKSYVMREGRQLLIDLYALIHEGDESQNIIMQGGDQIFIAKPSEASIMVTGEVGHSMVVPIPYGRLSLREALVRAGGIPFTGDKNCIYIIRGDLTRPKIYSLAWKEITSYPNQSLLLMPGDIVVVSEKPITQWNRFIDQLNLSAACMRTGGNIYFRWKK